MNSKGQIIITDLILYIILIIIILTIILYAINFLDNNQVMVLNNHEKNNILDNAMNTLINTEGTPNNWDKININNIKTVGLRKNESSSLISNNKLSKLKDNGYILDNLFPKGISYSLTIYPKNNPKDITYIAGGKLIDKKNIYSKQVPIIIDYGYNIYSFNSNFNCYLYNHSKNWECMSLVIDKSLLNNGTYYILTENSTNYIISNTYDEKITSNTTKKIQNINNQLNQLIKSDNDTVFIHLNTNKNHTYLVYDSNNEEEHLNSVSEVEIHILRLQIAI